MKIAFDLDDTLIPTTRKFSVGSKTVSFPYSLIFKEEIRVGAVGLLQQLANVHEIWVYTTSLRSSTYVRCWFNSFGVKLFGFINAQTHAEKVRGTQYSRLSKAPKLFGIDVLVDDSPGVLIECQQQGSHCILVRPDDNNWLSTIMTELQL
ncbi:hypothetical protein [Spartinivicinus poritis]|uniref:FCP1 homology domain-containing protein n=1 Tax=Spartinivicinus poritis TaxID=2994640 RepID=A0ABT5UD38_9GAMM|nr:hypothetical protein [Spartinivicinus sp. A2-2]MDE1464291.1 hypothetical protein [Spartinivicinus sp. A2-2]